MQPFQKILVAVDYSPHSAAAVDEAGALAKALGAEVYVVHAFSLSIPMVTPYEIAIPEPYIEESRAAAAEKLAEVAKSLSDAGVAVQTSLVEAPAASAIAREAERLGVDVIVMGTRGNTGLKHLFLGSVAEATLRLAPCSVWTVKGPSDD